MKFFILDARLCKVIGTGFEALSEAAAKKYADEYLAKSGFCIEEGTNYVLLRQVEWFSRSSSEVWSVALALHLKRSRAPIG